ncbi:hypothetical protein NC651_033834 [Populus alba x Populus x berolinensis]|nr:hypothetical protein NC651_033834 [Populus alba x Populus x berolinensis]
MDVKLAKRIKAFESKWTRDDEAKDEVKTLKAKLNKERDAEGNNSLALAMARATGGREKIKMSTMEQDLFPMKELVDAGKKSTVGRDECLLKLVVYCCSQLVQGLARRVLLELMLSLIESCIKIFHHYCYVVEDSIVAARKGRSLLILAGTMKTPLLPLHGSDHALLLLLRGGATGDEDDGDVMLLDEKTLLMFLLIFTCFGRPIFLVSDVSFVALVSGFVSLGLWPSVGHGSSSP